MFLLLGTMLGCASHSTTLPVHMGADEQPGLSGQVVVDGPLSARLQTDDAEVILFYGGEEQGSLEPCGCPQRPRGGLARLAAYVGAAAEANPQATALILNGGYWLEDAVSLDGQLRPDTPVRNTWMMVGLLTLGVDALNVGYNDLIGLRSLSPGVDRSELPLVSANVQGPDINTHRMFRHHNLRIAVTGISTEGSASVSVPAGFTTADPHAAARETLRGLRDQADIIVLLAYKAPDAARRLAETGLVDVVIDTNTHRERYAPFRVGDAVWVRSHYQTHRLGELRLGLGTDGQITWATDRKIDLDPEIPAAQSLQRVVRAARAEITPIQRQLYAR